MKQFYTHPFALMQTLGSGAEEYARILDLVARYAISRPDVGFSCKKQVNTVLMLLFPAQYTLMC